MELLHSIRMVSPDFLTDDFGDKFQVIPGEYCRTKEIEDEFEQRVVNAESWWLLFDPNFEDKSCAC